MKERNYLKKFSKIAKEYVKNFFRILPNVVIPLIIMVLIREYFGQSNSIIGVVLIFVCMLKVNQLKSLKTYTEMSGIIIVICILASIASLNLYTSIFLNLIIPFLIIYLTTSKQEQKGYFIYGFYGLLVFLWI